LKIITTWLYLESTDEAGEYSQVSGDASSNEFQDIYRRCLISFFLTSKRYNTDSKLILFTNSIKNIGKTNIGGKVIQLLSELNVEIIELKYKYAPAAQQKKWRNQFFVLDVIEYLILNSKIEDLILILDSDIVWTGNGDNKAFWATLQKKGSLAIYPISNPKENINGYSLLELNHLASEIGYKSIYIQDYVGGEFIALRGDKLRLVFKQALEVLNYFRKSNSYKQFKFIEEAHLLTITYTILNLKFNSADDFIRRIWTQIFHYQNRKFDDINLLLWHLLAEKKYGLKRLNNKILIQKSMHSSELLNTENLNKYLGVSKNTLLKIFFDLFYALNIRLKLILHEFRIVPANKK